MIVFKLILKAKWGKDWLALFFAYFSFYFFQVNMFDYSLINILRILVFYTCSSSMCKHEHKSAKS